MLSKKALFGHFIFILLIIGIGYFNIKEFGGFNEMIYKDSITSYYPKTQILREAMFKYGKFFPLWQPYIMGGSPYHDGTGVDIISYFGILNLILPNAFVTVGLTYISSYIMCGITMYILGLYLFKKQKYAFLSAIIFMLSGYPTSRFGEGTMQLCGLSILPLAFLFLVKIFKEKNWIKNSIICGILVALEIKVAPDLKITLFMSLLFGLYLFFQLIGKNLKSRIIKITVVSVLLLTIIFGLTTHSSLMQKQNLENSAIFHSSWERSSGRRTSLKQLFPNMVEPFNTNTFKIRYMDAGGKQRGKYKIGIFAFLLAMYALFKKPKNKFILFLLFTVLLTISIATASFVFYFLWKYIPPWHSFRYVERAFVLWSFSGALLAGVGAKYLSEDIKKRFSSKKANITVIIITVLVIANLLLFIRIPINIPTCNVHELTENAEALQYIKKIKEENGEIFRIHDWETTGIDWPTDTYTVPLGLEHLFGQTAIWRPEYMNQFLSIAYRDPAKFWGILNVKYLTSRKKLNISNFKLIKEFERFESDGKCPPPNQSTWNDPNADAAMKAFGQYLYKNENYLPRAYIVNNSLLVVGEKDSVTQTIYGLMLNQNFKPPNTVIIKGKPSINDYDPKDLMKFSAIFLTQGSIDQNSIFKLQQYLNSGGILLPDITKNKNSVSEDEITALFNSFEGNLHPIDDKNIIMHNFEKREIKLNNQKGFLVYSEKFSIFEGWTVKDQNKKQLPLLSADEIITSVYLEGNEENLIFEYKPKAYKIGLIITILTIITVTCYFVYKKIRKSVNNEKTY